MSVWRRYSVDNSNRPLEFFLYDASQHLDMEAR